MASNNSVGVKRSHPDSTPYNFRTPNPLTSSVTRTPAPQTPHGTPTLFSHTPHMTPHLKLVRVQVNDDEAERKRLRLKKNMQSMISPGCHTPKGASGSAHKNRSRAVESSSSSLTDTQLTEHYANCIKLSSQNKISSKNAFGLHLIDHMSKLLKMRGEMSNFQIASSTLDAGAKIYAGRVDSIYNDIFKVLGGLGRENIAALNRGGEAEEGAGGEEEVREKRAGKKSKKSGTGLMIEQKPDNLIGEFDLASRVDPLFQKTAAAFDEGGAKGLMLNNLIVQDDGCSLSLDASRMPVSVDKPVQGITVHIEEGLLDRDAIMTRQICPTFANFKFNCTDIAVDRERTWNTTNLHGKELEGRSGGVGQGADFTMLDCPGSAPEESAGDDTDFGSAAAVDADADETFSAADRGDTTNLGVLKDTKVACFMPGTNMESGRTLTSGLGDLCLTELIAPSDYSYFNPSALASWAGPQHWKFRPRKALTATADPVEKPVAKAKRRKASAFKVDFTKTPAKTLFAAGKASTKLSKAALSKLDTSLTTLPRDTHTDVDVLHRLFSQPKWKIRRQKKSTGVVDENLEGNWYDYGNTNDQQNYIPPAASNAEESDDAAEAMDDTSPEFSSHGFMNETAPPPGGVALGLVDQPHRVDQVRVDYARTAKKIDVKKLKSKMWDVISKPQEEEQVDSSEGSSVGVGFSSLYSELPSMVSSGMAKNLSIPICFVCLLHLANEKELRLEDTADMSDFSIFTT